MPLFTPAAPKTITQARRLYEKERLPAKEIAERVGLHASTILRYAKLQGWTRDDAADDPPASAREAKSGRRPTTPKKIAAKTKATRKKATRKKATRKKAAVEKPVRPKSAANPRPKRAVPATPDEAPAMSGTPPPQAEKSPAARVAQAVVRAIGAAERQLEEIERRLGAPPRDATQRERDARTFSIVSRALRDLAALTAAWPDEATSAEDDGDDIEAQDPEALAAVYRERIARVLEGIASEGRVLDDAADGDAAAIDGGAQRKLEF